MALFKPIKRADQIQADEEITDDFLMACSDCFKDFDNFEKPLAEIADWVKVHTEVEPIFAVGFGRNVRPWLVVFDHLARSVGIVALNI